MTHAGLRNTALPPSIQLTNQPRDDLMILPSTRSLPTRLSSTCFAISICIVLLLPVSAVSAQDDFPTPQRMQPQIIAQYPHDASAFTQGLLWHDGDLYESTGLYGESSLRRVDLETGDVEQQIAVLREDIPAGETDYFAEGLTLVDDRLIQLTWQSGEAFVYDLDFEQVGSYRYDGEGWGLCYDGPFSVSERRYPFHQCTRRRNLRADREICRDAAGHAAAYRPAQRTRMCRRQHLRQPVADRCDRTDQQDRRHHHPLHRRSRPADRRTAQPAVGWAGAERHRLQSGERHVLHHRQAVAVPVRGRLRAGRGNIITMTATFPPLSACTLSGRTVHLPDSISGEYCLAMLYFNDGQQAEASSWLTAAQKLHRLYPRLSYAMLPVRATDDYSDERACHEAVLLREQYDRWALHPFVAPLLVDLDTFCDYLQITQQRTTQVILFDREGEVCWRTSGYITANKRLELQDALQNLPYLEDASQLTAGLIDGNQSH